MKTKLKSIKGFRPNPREVKKLQNDLSNLDAHYLLNHPTKMTRTTYLKKRDMLRKRFNKMKNTIR
jgi:hypothetical protein|tara:strand:+ start:2940 stop:3134 length:195 start_codon:yes stop_codon:yes gene_type:complete